MNHNRKIKCQEVVVDDQAHAEVVEEEAEVVVVAFSEEEVRRVLRLLQLGLHLDLHQDNNLLLQLLPNRVVVCLVEEWEVV